MNRTAWNALLGFTLLNLAVACKGDGKDAADDTDTTPPTTDETGDTGAGLLLPEYYGFTAGFAHESVTDIARPYLFDGEESEPFMIFTLATEAWLQGNSDDESCVIYVDQPGTFPRAGWATEAEGYLFGVDFEVTEESSFSTNCMDVFDVDQQYVIDFLVNIGMACRWGFAVTPELDGDLEDALGANASDYRGGYVSFNECEEFEEAGIDVGLTAGYELDEDWELFQDADNISADDMLVTVELPDPVDTDVNDTDANDTDTMDTDTPPAAVTTALRLADGYFEIQTFIFYGL
ncbi:MAG TPA: hypothetical protein PKA64_02540 [Myxococcota bacterium]|nr:hypothetical protein [Myxococcota bacterium]